MFRESAKLSLSVTEWKAESTFVNTKGEQLSDQLPVKATMKWRVR